MAMIFRRPGKTGIENLDAGKPVGGFNGNNCHSSSNERNRTMKLNSIIFYLCACVCSSALIDNAFSMNEYAFETFDSYMPTIGLGAENCIIKDGHLQLPNDVTYINDCMFCGRVDIKSIDLTNVTHIGDSAFNGCSGLTSITIPGSVISIGYGAFCGCTELASITMSNNISGLHSDTFYECGKVNFNVASEAMKKYLCSNCNIAEDKVTVDSSLYNEHYSWKWPEDGCIHFPADTTRIADYMFCGRSDIKSVDLTNVAYIGVYAFEGCTGLSSIAIPNTVEYIDGYAFAVCDALTYVTIPNSVTSIYHNAFFISNYDAKIKVASESMKKLLYYSNSVPEDYQIVVDSSLYEEQNAWKWPENGHIQLPTDVTCITDYMFWGRSDILSVTLQNSITSIGQGAFENCTGLLSITIPNSVTEIGVCAFYRCTGLNEINVYSEVTKQLVIDSTPGINPDIIKVIE